MDADYGRKVDSYYKAPKLLDVSAVAEGKIQNAIGERRLECLPVIGGSVRHTSFG